MTTGDVRKGGSARRFRSAGSERPSSRARRVAMTGFGDSDSTEWKMSGKKMDAWREGVKGRTKRSFHTGRVDLESSDLGEMRLLGSTQKTQ